MNSLLDSNNVKYIIGVLIIIVILYMIMHKDGFSNSVLPQPNNSQQQQQQLEQQLLQQLEQQKNIIQQVKATTPNPIELLILNQNLTLLTQQIQYTNEQINVNKPIQNNIDVYQKIIPLRQQQINLQLELLRQITQAKISTLTPAMEIQTKIIHSIENNIKSLYNNLIIKNI